jgi:hypothetical protein
VSKRNEHEKELDGLCNLARADGVLIALKRLEKIMHVDNTIRAALLLLAAKIKDGERV